MEADDGPAAVQPRRAGHPVPGEPETAGLTEPTVTVQPQLPSRAVASRHQQRAVRGLVAGQICEGDGGGAVAAHETSQGLDGFYL